MANKRVLADIRSFPTRERKSIEPNVLDWIPFFRGSENLYPQELALKYRRSPTHSAIVNTKVNYTAGESLILDTDTEVTDTINSEGDTFWSLYKKICQSWILFGNVWVEIVRKSGQNFPFVHDPTKVRLARDRQTAFVSPFWREIKNGRPTNAQKVEAVRMMNNRRLSGMLHFRRDMPEYDYYGLPCYLAINQDVEVEYRVNEWNLNRLDKGFMPDAYIGLKGDPPEGYTPKQYAEAIRDRYTGEKREGLVVEMLDSESDQADIHEFNGSDEGEFMKLEESAYNSIIRGHRWFPALSGIETSGKLGNYKELINQYNIVMNTVVKPDYRRPTIEFMNMILEIMGVEFRVEDVVHKPPFGIESELDVNRIVSKDEGRRLLGLDEIGNDEFINNGRQNRDNNSN